MTNPLAPPPAASAFVPTDRTRIRRVPSRAVYDRAVVNALLDEGLVAHVGFVAGDQHYVIPMVYARRGEELFLHGAAASRLLKGAAGGLPLCATVTLVDGLVFARSAFHHSMNYRSVVILGQARAVVDPEEKQTALAAFLEHMAKGRAGACRPPNAKELAATAVLSLPLDEVSAKVRTGGPVDDADDLPLPFWAGHVPLRLTTSPAITDAVHAPAADIPSAFLHGLFR